MKQKDSNKSSQRPLLVFLAAVFGFLFLLLLLLFHNHKTLKIGIFYGSNWEVPGTIHYDIFDQAIKKYEKTHPGIRVEYEEGIPSEEYSEWLSGEILKGTEPDVYMVLNEDFNTLAASGALEPLDSRIQFDRTDCSVFYDSALRAGIYGGRRYAMPFECNPTLMFVNKTLLKEEGIPMPRADWTWEDFYDICSRVGKDEDGDGKPDRFGFYDYTWQQAVCSNGIGLFRKNGMESTLTDSRFQEAVRFLRRLEKTKGGYQVSANDFDLGKVVFRPLTFSEYRTYMPYPWRIKKYSDFEWNCVSMPAGPSGSNSASMETLMVGVSARTAKKKEAWEFVKLLTMDEEIQKLIYRDASGASVLKKVTNSGEIMRLLNEDTPGESDIDLSLLNQAIEAAVPSENFLFYEEAMEKANHVLTALVASDADIHTGLFNLTKEIDKIIR
ncbi:MAG: extracellular solute-binding protein [Eubacteriales bacterium]|nr:extracellular solute-binding protein [Eubacteriales bacterium]